MTADERLSSGSALSEVAAERNLDSTQADNCPLGHRCESCGAESRSLHVITHNVLNATYCLTMCPKCAASGQPPQIMLSTAERLVAAHTEHLRRRLIEPRTVVRVGAARRQTNA